MNTIFLVTGETPDHVKNVGQWFANRVANVYPSIADVGSSIPEMPVAILVEGEVQGVVPALRKVSKAAIVHVHIGPDVCRKAQGADRFAHWETPKKLNAKDVQFLMRLEALWREEKAIGRPVNDRAPIKVPC
jgi:hypothetical protein